MISRFASRISLTFRMHDKIEKIGDCDHSYNTSTIVACTLLLESERAEVPNNHHFFGCWGDVIGEAIGERLHNCPCAGALYCELVY